MQERRNQNDRRSQYGESPAMLYVAVVNGIIKLLIKDLEKVESQLPDDQWDEHHWQGVKAGLIRAISAVSGIELNYHLTSAEIKKQIKK